MVSSCARDDASLAGNLYHNFTAFFNAYYNAGVEYEKGIKAMKSSVSYDRNARLQIFISLENAQQGKQFFDKVIEKAGAVVQAHPNSDLADNALLLMGRAYYYQREFQPAERKFKEVISNYPTSDILDEATFWYGRTLSQQQQTSEAREILGGVIASPRTAPNVRADAHFSLAELAIRDEAFDEAEKQIRLGLPLATDNDRKATAAFVLARIYDQLGKYDQAAQFYQLVLSLDTDYELRYAAQLSYALDLREQNNLDEAIEAFMRMLSDDKNLDKFAEIRYELSQCYEKQDRLGKAIDLYLEIIRKNPRTEGAAKSYYRLGLIKQDISRDYETARALFDSSKIEFAQGEINKAASEASERMTKILSLYEAVAALDSTIRLGIVSQKKTEKPRDTLDAQPDAPTVQRTRRDYRRSAFLASGARDAFGDTLTTRQTEKRQRIVFDAARDTATLLGYKRELLNRYSGIGNFYQTTLPIPDSAIHWHRFTLRAIDDSLNVFPDSMKPAVRALQEPILYALADAHRLKNELSETDSIYKLMLERYPKSRYAERIRIYYNMPSDAVEQTKDYALYQSAIAGIERREFRLSLKRLDSLLTRYPRSPLRPKALLAKGYIYETSVALPDSAIAIYKQLELQYPSSPEALSIQAKLQAVALARAPKLDTVKSKSVSPKDTTQKSVPVKEAQTRNALPAAPTSTGVKQPMTPNAVLPDSLGGATSSRTPPSTSRNFRKPTPARPESTTTTTPRPK